MKNNISFKIRNTLCAAIAFTAVFIDLPPTMFWMYEPKTPAKFKNK